MSRDEFLVIRLELTLESPEQIRLIRSIFRWRKRLFVVSSSTVPTTSFEQHDVVKLNCCSRWTPV